MEVFINVGTDKRVKSYGSTGGDGWIKITVADNHEFHKNPFIYKFISGQLIKDSAYQKDEIEKQKEIENAPTEIEVLQEENTVLKMALAEMAESAELAKMENQLALAELAEMITGGA